MYGLIDRQFLPPTLRIFDFANPDLHSGRRSETLVPQQSLYFLNDPFVGHRAKSLAAKLEMLTVSDPTTNHVLLSRISQLYRATLMREPTSAECDAALEFLRQPDGLAAVDQPELAGSRRGPLELSTNSAQAWSYGYGEVDESSGKLKSFDPFPYYSGSAWQGGQRFPRPQNRLGSTRLDRRTSRQ